MEVHMFDWVAHHALTRPNDVVFRLLETEETRTWAELEARVGRLAHALQTEFSLTKGDAVSVLAENDIRCFEVQFACIRLGLLFAPLNFRLSIAELEEQVGIVKPRLLITDSSWEATAQELLQRTSIETLLSWAPGADTVSAYDRKATEGPSMPPRTDASAEDVVHILFTSGTTGIPKGATTTLGAMAWQAFNQIEFARVSDADAHVLSPLPLFHGGALHSLCNPVLCFGGQITICQRFDPAACVKYAGDPANHVTHMSLVPVMYQMMADTAEFATADLSLIRAALVAGGSVSKALYEAYEQKGVYFSSQYGATETGPTVMALNPARKDKILAGSCGQKAMSVEVRLVNFEGIDAPTGEPGEIWVRGPAVMRRYFAIDPATGFVDGWFATGDVGVCDDDGFYYVVGRTKEMYKSGGENVFPLEVEKVLISHPSIEDVAIVAIPHDKWGEVGMAVVVLKPGAALTLDEVRQHCEGRLARYKHPLSLEIVDELPRGPMNKVAKADLKKRFLEAR
nr:AMP-binding protein [Sphingomonas sp. CDS-1]